MDNNYLNNLLDLRGKGKNDILDRFDVITKELFNNYVIEKNDNSYRFLEIEFYYYSDNHKDAPTYKRICEPGWFFHQSGVDISFYSDENEYGGILIRSIQNIESKEFTSGPIRVVDEIFDLIKFDQNMEIDISSIPKIVFIEDKLNIDYFKTTRYGISGEDKEYRYFDSQANFDGKKQYIINLNK